MSKKVVAETKEEIKKIFTRELWKNVLGITGYWIELQGAYSKLEERGRYIVNHATRAGYGKDGNNNLIMLRIAMKRE